MKYHSQPQYLRVEGTLKSIFCNYDCLYDIHQRIEKPNSFLAIRKDKISEYNTVEKKYKKFEYTDLDNDSIITYKKVRDLKDYYYFLIFSSTESEDILEKLIEDRIKEIIKSDNKL